MSEWHHRAPCREKCVYPRVSPGLNSTWIRGAAFKYHTQVTCVSLLSLTSFFLLTFSLQWWGWTAAPSLTRHRRKSEEEEEASELKTGRGEWGLELWMEKETGERVRGVGGGGCTQECKTDWFICEVATEQRLDLYGPPSTFGPHFDSSSLHIESNSIYQCAWTQPLWQYQPLSVPVSLEIRNHRYMPVQLVLTDYSSN